MTLPLGCLIPIGGAEDKDAELPAFFEYGIIRSILSQIPEGEDPRIEVVTSASAEPDETYEAYRAGFGKLGCGEVRHLRISDRPEAGSDATIKRLEDCNCVMITGGDQLRLSTTLGGTAALDVIRRRYREERFIVAGSSAGAMVLSNPMIYAGRAERATLKGSVRVATGFGLLPDTIIDTHVDKRGRFTRLAQAVAAQPGALGIGLGEDTGLVVTGGHQMEVIGSGSILLLDGRAIVRTNIAEIGDGAPISVRHLLVHLLAAGDRYDLSRHSFPDHSSKAAQHI